MSQEAIVTRVFDAPREMLWRYFTEPELFAAWFGTPPFTSESTKHVSVWEKPAA